jgi:hypothetical protein
LFGDASGNSRGGPLGLTLGANQTEEATVITSTYSGQFGGAAGGNVNYVTKSGSNAFHGNAQYYWNGRVLNANDWLNKAAGNPRPFSNANQWTGSLGGPISNLTLDKGDLLTDRRHRRTSYIELMPRCP